MQVVTSVRRAAEIPSPFPELEGEERLAWPNPDAQVGLEAPGQSHERPLTGLGAGPAFHSPVCQMCLHCPCPSGFFHAIYHL